MRFAKVAVVLGAVLTATFAFVPAAAADSAPCGPAWYHQGIGQYVQTCPDWSPNNSIPVHVQPDPNSRIVGYIYAPGDDWYICEVSAARQDAYGYHNVWWATTKADNGNWGWVSEVYFAGGGNDEPDAGLRSCF